MRTKLLRKLRREARRSICSIVIANEEVCIRDFIDKKMIKTNRKLYIVSYSDYCFLKGATSTFKSVDDIRYVTQRNYINNYINEERAKRLLKQLTK